MVFILRSRLQESGRALGATYMVDEQLRQQIDDLNLLLVGHPAPRRALTSKQSLLPAV
jgi:hypothetical protein